MTSPGLLASIDDRGSNNGQIIGLRVPVELFTTPEKFAFTVTIGSGAPISDTDAALPVVPLPALCFAMNQTAALGYSLTAWKFVSTGGLTGVHWVQTGRRCRADFGDPARIHCVTSLMIAAQ